MGKVSYSSEGGRGEVGLAGKASLLSLNELGRTTNRPSYYVLAVHWHST